MINSLKIRIKFIYLRIQQESYLWTLNKIFHKSIPFVIYTILIPLILILKIKKIKIVPILTSRIGHLAGEADCFIKLNKLGLIDSKYKYYLIKDENKICNLILFGYISDHFKVVSNKFYVFLLKFMVIGPGIKHNISDYILSIQTRSRYYEVNNLWNNKNPVFNLNKDHIEIGSKILLKLGVPERCSFVCVHVRTEGYSVEDDKVHQHRNFPADSLIESIKLIISKGDKCILMGQSNAPYFPNINGLIDYAHSSYQNDLMDVFLCANTKFFLGNSSGLYILSTVFNRPCALTNLLPFANTGFNKMDLSIPKLIKHTLSNKILTLNEIMDNDISKYRNHIQFKNANKLDKRHDGSCED
jgi:putative glycosyltransferase (TIGR04372 family)